MPYSALFRHGIEFNPRAFLDVSRVGALPGLFTGVGRGGSWEPYRQLLPNYFGKCFTVFFFSFRFDTAQAIDLRRIISAASALPPISCIVS